MTNTTTNGKWILEHFSYDCLQPFNEKPDAILVEIFYNFNALMERMTELKTEEDSNWANWLDDTEIDEDDDLNFYKHNFDIDLENGFIYLDSEVEQVDYTYYKATFIADPKPL